jgi:hypothetical protein
MFGLDWIETLAIIVVALVLFACFWGTLSRRELLGRGTITGRPHRHLTGADHHETRSSPSHSVPSAGEYHPDARSTDTALTIETARWLRNMVQMYLQQGKFTEPTASFLRSQAGTDAVLEHIYRVHATQQQQVYTSEEESLIAACEMVAGGQSPSGQRR